LRGFLRVYRLKTVQRFRNPRLLYWNLGNGKFEDVSSRAGNGLTVEHSRRGASAGDFDNDGDIDLLICSRHCCCYLVWLLLKPRNST
jgi:hypothetical protein